jgi:hypothetical protein
MCNFGNEQAETIYRRLDDGSHKGRAELTVARELRVGAGEFYTLHPLANDTACVWRHRFDPDAGTVAAFRSGCSNAPCPPEGSGHHSHGPDPLSP